MATPVQQSGFTSARTNSSGNFLSGFLYAEIQNSGIGKKGVSDSCIPHSPLTPRVPNQVQQRNVLRKWMGLPPIESNWQRAGRQAALAANHAIRTGMQSLASLANHAAASWEGMSQFIGDSCIPALPVLHIGLPGAAAQAVPGEMTAADQRSRRSVGRPSSSSLSFLDCIPFLRDSLGLLHVSPNMSTVETMLTACPTVDCSDDAKGQLDNVTVVIESGKQLHPLLIGLAARGSKNILLSTGDGCTRREPGLPQTYSWQQLCHAGQCRARRVGA